MGLVVDRSGLRAYIMGVNQRGSPMAMFIVSENVMARQETCIHIGEKIDDPEGFYNVLYVQADGDELKMCEYIIDSRARGRVHKFVGDNAREIILNWNDYQ
jgi:hypothetical protein